jgi:hypothetical protein
VDANYDEAKVGTLALPELLVTRDGAPLRTAAQWESARRREIIDLFAQHMYGRSPGRPDGLAFEPNATRNDALEGVAARWNIRIRVPSKPRWQGIDVELHIPDEAAQPVPAFVGLRFGDEPHRWPVDAITRRGYALATAHYADLEPDSPEGWRTGVRGTFDDDAAWHARPNERWAAIAAWAWGLSRMLDLLQTLPQIDASRIAVVGHSRLGKAALWAGAQDTRAALVVSNNSGKGGAAILRRNFGETIAHLNASFPHWFCGNFRRHDENAASLPVDAHMLIASIAPRPVYIASAAEDLWADPKGEFLAGRYADPVYRLYGRAGIGAIEQPPVDRPGGDFIGYHVRTGAHDLTAYDWMQFLNFADRHFGA